MNWPPRPTSWSVRPARICAADPALRDHAPWALRTAIRELLVRVPVYRPYTTAGGPCPESAEAARLRGGRPPGQGGVRGGAGGDRRRCGAGTGARQARRRARTTTAFCARFAQTASALRAKSVEDTAFYRYVPLISANEVGGDPGNPAVSPERFHAYCARLARDWPATGTVLTTHDTKRSADVRAGIAVLSECPQRWDDLLEQVAGRCRRPDPQVAWQAWQTAVGFTPADRDGEPPEAARMVPALLKSVREAGLHTSWTEADPLYERAVTEFVEAGPAGPARRTVAAFTRALAPVSYGASALGAALVQLTMPGVPDLYQGTEREYVALVDPDNRAPVPYRAARREDRCHHGGAAAAPGTARGLRRVGNVRPAAPRAGPAVRALPGVLPVGRGGHGRHPAAAAAGARRAAGATPYWLLPPGPVERPCWRRTGSSPAATTSPVPLARAVRPTVRSRC